MRYTKLPRMAVIIFEPFLTFKCHNYIFNLYKSVHNEEVQWVCAPAGVSLAAAGVDALRQRVVQTGINHIEADGFLMYLTAGVPVQQINMMREEKTKTGPFLGHIKNGGYWHKAAFQL